MSGVGEMVAEKVQIVSSLLSSFLQLSLTSMSQPSLAISSPNKLLGLFARPSFWIWTQFDPPQNSSQLWSSHAPHLGHPLFTNSLTIFVNTHPCSWRIIGVVIGLCGILWSRVQLCAEFFRCLRTLRHSPSHPSSNPGDFTLHTSQL